MTEQDVQDFVTRFAAAWATRDGEAFLALWHPEGVLHSPFYDRAVAGKELGWLTDFVAAAAPDLVWQLLDWTARGDVVVIEWQTTRIVGGQRLDTRGVDKFPPARRQDIRGAGLYRHRAAQRGTARRGG